MEHAQAFEPVQDGRIYIEKINVPFLFGDKATRTEYSAGLRYAIRNGLLELHESGIREADAKRRGPVRLMPWSTRASCSDAMTTNPRALYMLLHKP
jgi:hypothetical protein